MAERKIRSAEERIAELDSKISFHKNAIEKLEKRKEDIRNPKKRRGRVGVLSIVKAAKESGMTVEEMAEKLGIDL